MIVITAYGGMRTVMRSMRGKAFDYLPKPLDLDRAVALAERARQSRAAPPEPPAPARTDGEEGPMVGASPAMQDVYKQIARIAALDAAVLVLGETGTGKELVARAIHEHSARSAGPFIAVNCGSLPEKLVESELFGHVRGAFTGADTDRTGRFQAADGGTLFLDEVGELPPDTQVKLLRVLDSQVIERVGSVDSIHLNVRMLAATNRDLTDDVRARRFRADLYYRLAVLHIRLPRLANRREDILPLARHFLASDAPPDGPVLHLDAETERALLAHAWPGNVRELRNAMTHAMAVAPSRRIRPDDLPETVRSRGMSAVPAGGNDEDGAARRYIDGLSRTEGDLYAKAVKPVEEALFRAAMNECRGNQSQAAALLGLHRNTLRKKLRQLGLGTKDWGTA